MSLVHKTVENRRRERGRPRRKGRDRSNNDNIKSNKQSGEKIKERTALWCYVTPRCGSGGGLDPTPFGPRCMLFNRMYGGFKQPHKYMCLVPPMLNK